MQTANSTRAGKAMSALPHYAEGGLIRSIKSAVSSFTDDRKPNEAPIGTGAAAKAKAAITTRKQMLDEAEKKAMGMAKGGEIVGPGTGTSDDVPIMGSDGEYMVKAKAVKKLGVPFMDAINSIADGPGDKKKSKPAAGAVQKMAGGGMVRKTPAERLVEMNATAAASRVAKQAAELESRTTLGAAPANNSIKFVMPPEPIDATTSPGARGPAPAKPAAAAKPAAPAARPTTPYSGDPMHPQPGKVAPERPYQAPAAGPRPEAVMRGTGFTVTPPPKPPSMASRAMSAVKSAAPALGPAALIAGAIPEQLQVARVAADPNTTKNDVMTQQAQGIGRYASAGAGALGGAALGAMTGPAAPVMAPLGAVAGGLYGYYAADKAIEGGRNAVGTDPRAPVDQLAAPAAAPIQGGGSGKRMDATQDPRVITPTMPTPVAQAQAPDQAATLPLDQPNNTVNVARQANGNMSFSGENVSGPVQYAGAKGAGFKPSGAGVTTMPAANFMSSNPSMDQRLSEARNAAMARGDIDAVKASYAAQGQEFGPKVSAVDQLMNNGKPMTARKAAAIAALKAAEADQSGKKEDRELAREKFGLEKTTTGLSAKAKERLNAAEEAVTKAKTPDERKSALQTLEALQGRSQREAPAKEFAAIAGGTDAMGNKTDPIVYSTITGQRVDQRPQAPIGSNPQAVAIRDDKTMSVEQKRAALKQLGYQ